jgi:NADH-quinone oxidoreductase subunit E
MPEDFRKPAAIEKPEQPDDLKAISGIGPKLERVLNDLGVWTYAQIADWHREEIAWVDDTLGFKGRIERDAWLAQAAKFAGAKAGTSQ